MARRLCRKTAAIGLDCHHGIVSLGKTRERSEDRFRLCSGTEVERENGKGRCWGVCHNESILILFSSKYFGTAAAVISDDIALLFSDALLGAPKIKYLSSHE